VEELLELWLGLWRTIEALDKAVPLLRLQGELLPICEDALSLSYGRVDHELGQCRIRRRGGLPDDLVSLARDAKDSALGLWHAVNMHTPLCRCSPTRHWARAEIL
jgi:hypothetical protein